MGSKLDLTGERFGKLVALRETRIPEHRRGATMTWWECLCDCGGRYTTTTSQLRDGLSSCGCDRGYSTKGGRPRLNLAGQRYGMLTVTGELLPRQNPPQWACDCDCGGWHLAKVQTLRRRMVRSCGCLTGRRAAERRAAMAHADKHARFADTEKGIPAHWWMTFFSWTVEHSIALHLTIDEAWQMHVEGAYLCCLTGEVLNFRSNYPECAPALKRKDPGIGYTLENSMWVSRPLVMTLLEGDTQRPRPALKLRELVPYIANYDENDKK